MNNDQDGFGSFWFWLAVVSNYCQIESYELNKMQISNDELLQASEGAFGIVVLNMPIMQLVVFASIIGIIIFLPKFF